MGWRAAVQAVVGTLQLRDGPFTPHGLGKGRELEGGWPDAGVDPGQPVLGASQPGYRGGGGRGEGGRLEAVAQAEATMAVGPVPGSGPGEALAGWAGLGWGWAGGRGGQRGLSSLFSQLRSAGRSVRWAGSPRTHTHTLAHSPPFSAWVVPAAPWGLGACLLEGTEDPRGSRKWGEGWAPAGLLRLGVGSGSEVQGCRRALGVSVFPIWEVGFVGVLRWGC